MINNRLSNREFDIMAILWNSSKPLLASEILKESPELNINTVQAVLRKLLNKNYIGVASIVQSGKVLGRTYEPLISRESYIIEELGRVFPATSEQRNRFFSVFMEKEPDKQSALDELEHLIKEYRSTM